MHLTKRRLRLVKLERAPGCLAETNAVLPAAVPGRPVALQVRPQILAAQVASLAAQADEASAALASGSSRGLAPQPRRAHAALASGGARIAVARGALPGAVGPSPPGRLKSTSACGRSQRYSVISGIGAGNAHAASIKPLRPHARYGW